MALVSLGRSKCPICYEVVRGGQLILAATHFIADECDPLAAYSDAAIHVTCFLSWEHRAAFAARYEATLGRRLTAWVPSARAGPGVE